MYALENGESDMKTHQIRVIILTATLIFLLAGCGDSSAGRLLSLPENIEQISVSYENCSNEAETWEIDSEGIADWAEWISRLSVKHETFDNGNTPNTYYAGGESYLFSVNKGEVSFSYYDFGSEAHIVYCDEWYKVSNPVRLPFQAGS